MNNDPTAGGLNTCQALFQTPHNLLLSQEFCCPSESNMDRLKISRLVISFGKRFSYHFLMFDDVTKPSYLGGGTNIQHTRWKGLPGVEGPPRVPAPFPPSRPSLPS